MENFMHTVICCLAKVAFLLWSEWGCWSWKISGYCSFPSFLSQPFIFWIQGSREEGGEMYTESQTRRDREGDGLFIQPLAISQGHSVLVCLWGKREYISLPHESDLRVCFFSQLRSNLCAFSLAQSASTKSHLKDQKLRVKDDHCALRYIWIVKIVLKFA